MDREYAKTMVDHLYDEGDRDIIFFGFIIGVVSFDREDAPYDKSEADRFNHALRLASFLLSDGDFSPGKSIRQENGNFRKTLYEGGFEEFRQDLENLFGGGGIDNIDLLAGPWLVKNNIGKSAPSLSDSICELFG
jgi:hypothetical protein